jgi:hypothetical protein
MTTATPDLPAVLSEAVDLVRDHVRAAVRAAEFRRLFRKAQAEIRSRGGEYNSGTVAALRASFPEYADMIPGNADLRALELPADNAPVVASPVSDDDDDEEPCEDHHDENARCTSCNGLPYERCDHDFTCGECNQEIDTCNMCELSDDCDHNWQCDECGQGVDLTGSVR